MEAESKLPPKDPGWFSCRTPGAGRSSGGGTFRPARGSPLARDGMHSGEGQKHP